MHTVAVEVLVLRAGSGGLAYRRRVAELPADRDPDTLAAELAGDPQLLHSTSWRSDPAWGLLLSYVAFPDTRAADVPGVPLLDLRVAAGTEATRPAPAAVSVDQVAAHAVRHLALLRRTDPVVAAALGADPGLDAAVAAADPVPAGRAN